MTAILFLLSQEKYLSMKVNINIMCASIKVFNLLASFHYIMNLSCTPIYEKNSAVVSAQQRCRSAWAFFMSIYAWP